MTTQARLQFESGRPQAQSTGDRKIEILISTPPPTAEIQIEFKSTDSKAVLSECNGSCLSGYFMLICDYFMLFFWLFYAVLCLFFVYFMLIFGYFMLISC